MYVINSLMELYIIKYELFTSLLMTLVKKMKYELKDKHTLMFTVKDGLCNQRVSVSDGCYAGTARDEP